MVRYKPSQFTKKELEAMVTALVPAAGLDFLTGGRLNSISRSAAVKIAKAVTRIAIPPVSLGGRLAGQAALGTARVLGSSAVGAAAPIVTNPYVLGGALGYGALQTQQGQDLLAAAEQRGRDDRIRFEQFLTDTVMPGTATVKATKKTTTKFNKAIKAGMSAAKASTSYGKKGTINNAKKAFTAVTKTASKINKGGKVAKKGVLRKIGLAIKKVLK